MAAYLETVIDVYTGLSSDNKATITSPKHGSIFIETDTVDIYKYNVGNTTWYKIANAGSMTGTAPYLVLWNTTEEDIAGGRESRVVAKGEQSGGEVTTLGYMEFSHEGALDDQKGQFRIYLNDGNDNNSPSKLALTLASTGASTLTDVTVTSIIIGANTLNTSEWAYLDGQDQALKTTNNVQHATLGLGLAPTTGLLHIKAGTATAGTAPIKLTSGTVLATPEAGAIEFNNDSLYYTKTTGPTRMTVAPLESPSFTTPNIGAATGTSLVVTGNVSQTSEIDNGNSGVSDTIAWAAGNCQKSTLTGNCVFTFTAPNGVGTLTLKLIQDDTGSRTVTWPGTVVGQAILLSTTAAAVDVIQFYYDGTNYRIINAVINGYLTSPMYLWR